MSILLAMTIPHAAFVGLCMTIKVFFSRWVTFVATETQATSILKWWYPLATTILLLHHARAFAAENSAEEEKDSKKSTSNKKSTKDKSSSSDNKKKNRRRRSSFGVPFHRTAPATSDSQNSNKDNAAGGEGPAPFIYTEEEMKEDAIYWLNFFVLRAIFSAIHTLATRIIVVRWLFDYPIVPSTIAQLELFFYIWIFVMPACFAILYPSAGDETSKDWSPIKRWCYQAALDPIFHIPMLFKDLVVPFFEQVSQAIPPSFWKRNVVDKVESILNGFVFVRMLSETRKDALVECLVNFQSLVLPALTFFTPGFITQYGVWYVEYIVPLAHSFKGLHKPHRHSQRVLYLQFWILHGIISAALRVTFGVLWWVPFTTHATFIVWCIMTMSRVISFLYNELDRELQTFGFLPKNPKHADDLVVEKAHTVRAFSYILSKLPSAVDKPENEAPDHDQKDNDIGDEDNAGGYDNVYDDDGDGTKEDKGTNNEDAKAAGEKSATKAAEKKKDDDAEEKENKASTNKDSKEEKTKKAAASSLPSTPTKDAGEKTEDLSPGQQLLRRSARHRRKSSS